MFLSFRHLILFPDIFCQCLVALADFVDAGQPLQIEAVELFRCEPHLPVAANGSGMIDAIAAVEPQKIGDGHDDEIGDTLPEGEDDAAAEGTQGAIDIS